MASSEPLQTSKHSTVSFGGLQWFASKPGNDVTASYDDSALIPSLTASIVLISGTVIQNVCETKKKPKKWVQYLGTSSTAELHSRAPVLFFAGLKPNCQRVLGKIIFSKPRGYISQAFRSQTILPALTCPYLAVPYLQLQGLFIYSFVCLSIIQPSLGWGV